MTRAFVVCMTLAGVLAGSPLHAQTRRYRVMAGASVNSVNPFDPDLGTDLGPGLIVRGVPRPGFGPIFDLTSAKVDLRRGRDQRELGDLRVRAILGGLGYTIEKGRLATTFGAAVGYAFNKAETRQDVIDRGARFDVSDGPLFRTGVTLTVSAGRRVALVTSLGALFLNPDVTLNTSDPSRQVEGSEIGTWPAHSLVWQVGVAFKVF